MARSRSGFTRKRKSWQTITQALVEFTTTQTRLLGSLGTTAADGPFTVMRLIGNYFVGPTSAPAAGDEATLSLAVGVVSTDAAGVGSSAMPDPTDEPEFPWLYYDSHQVQYTGTDPEASSAMGTYRRHIDVKSMRIIKPRESLVVIGQYTDGTGAPPVSLGTGVWRILVAHG